MLNLRRVFSVILPVAILAAASGLVWADNGTQASDDARKCWNQGVKLWESYEFQKAKTAFLDATKILEKEPNALPSDVKRRIDLYLNKADALHKKQLTARAAYNDAVAALHAKKLEEAKSGFEAVLATEKHADKVLTPTEYRTAKVKHAEVVAKIKVASAVTVAETGPKTEPKVIQPKVQPKVVTAEPKGDRKMLRDVARRHAKARDLLITGKKAMDNNQPERAVALFERALVLQPDLSEAQRLLEHARQLTASPKGEGILTRLQENLRVSKQMAQLEYDKTMARSQEALAGADSAEEFDSAENFARSAETVAEKNKRYFPDREYRELLRKVQAQLKHISLKRDDWQRAMVRIKQQEIVVAQEKRERDTRMRRANMIATLTQRAKTLTGEHKYASAKEILDQIIELDPNNRWASERRELLTQFILLQEERRLDKEQRYQEQRVLIDLREAEIPWYELLRYPRNWRELTVRRAPFGVGGGGQSETDRLVRQKLGVRVPKLDFNEIKFENVVEFLRDISGLSLHVKWNALQAAGIDKTTPVTVQLRDVTFEKALRVILDDVGGVNPLSYILDDGVITISTKEDLSRRTVTRVYDIRDLIFRVPNFPGPRIELSDICGASGNNTSSSSNGSIFGNDTGDNNRTGEDNLIPRSELINNIITLIKETVDPNSWRPTGEIGAIRELHGQLVVTQTAENQQNLVTLVNQLREARALQISIESRFIQVSSGYLNSIGVDLDLFFNIGSGLAGNNAINQNFVTDPFTGAQVPIRGGSGWGAGKPGTSSLTPVGVVTGAAQNQIGFGNMLSQQTPGFGAASIGAAVTSPALSVSGVFLDDIQVNFLIQATQAHSSTRQLTAPRITLFNGQRAYVTVGQQQAYVSAFEPVVADNTSELRPIISYVPTGTVLDVEATVSADRRYVTITVRPQVSTLNQLTQLNVGTGTVQLPIVTVQDLQTTVSVPDGGTLLLGGQKLASELENEMGVPILSKIPIINRLFTNRGRVRDEQTLLIMIKPKIIIQREEEERQFPDR